MTFSLDRKQARAKKNTFSGLNHSSYREEEKLLFTIPNEQNNIEREIGKAKWQLRVSHLCIGGLFGRGVGGLTLIMMMSIKGKKDHTGL